MYTERVLLVLICFQIPILTWHESSCPENIIQNVLFFFQILFVVRSEQNVTSIPQEGSMNISVQFYNAVKAQMNLRVR